MTLYLNATINERLRHLDSLTHQETTQLVRDFIGSREIKEIKELERMLQECYDEIDELKKGTSR